MQDVEGTKASNGNDHYSSEVEGKHKELKLLKSERLDNLHPRLLKKQT